MRLVFHPGLRSSPGGFHTAIVALRGIAGNILELENLDILDGTPLLDIKFYVPKFDAPQDVRCGWLDECSNDVRRARSDDRFQS